MTDALKVLMACLCLCLGMSVTHASAYRPFFYQANLHKARWDFPYRWLSGGVGSGKTIWAIHEMLYFTQEFAPGSNGLIVVPDYRTFEQVIEPELHNWWPPGIWRIDRGVKGPMIKVRTPKGIVTIFIRSGSNKRHVRTINGLTISWAYFEEGGRVFEGELAWKFTLERLRGAVINYKGRRLQGPIWVSGSPWPGWMVKEFGCEDGHPEEAWRTGYCPDSSDELKRLIFIHAAKTEFNTAIPPEHAYRMRLRFGEEWAAQELDGQVVQARGRILHNFYPSTHVREPEEVMLRFARTQRDNRFMGLDFGGGSSASANLAGAWERFGEQALLANEWYGWQKDEEEQGYHAWRVQQDLDIRGVYVPHDRPSNKRRLKKGFYYHGRKKADWTQDRSNWYSVDHLKDAQDGPNTREPGFSVIRNLLSVDHKTMEPRLIISKQCENWIREAKEARRPDAFDETKLSKPGEIAKGLDDHALDASRYPLFTDSTTVGTAGPSFVPR